MERCLVSGSHGFIGEHLVHQLEHQHYEVIRLERDWQKVPKVNYIFHLASFGNKYEQRDEEKIFKANVWDLWRLLQAVKEMDYRAFINFSTSGHVQQAATFYGGTKACGEHLVNVFANQYDKPNISIRPFSVYGPGDDPNHFIFTAIQAFKEDKVLYVAPGTHDWIYIDDLVKAVLLVAKNADKLKGESVDIGTGMETSNMGVVCILQDIFNKHGLIEPIDKMRRFDTNHWKADITLLKSLGWQPKFDLGEGLERCIYG